MRSLKNLFFFCAALPIVILLVTSPVSQEEDHDQGPPFHLDLLQPVKIKTGTGEETAACNPGTAYNVFINYELGR
jgi:hypothetical protein